jgi:hypothetical protein
MAVPNTNTFSLQNVVTEIGLGGSKTTLVDCFTNANSSGFVSAYQGSKDRLSNFRGYSHSLGGY